MTRTAIGRYLALRASIVTARRMLTVDNGPLPTADDIAGLALEDLRGRGIDYTLDAVRAEARQNLMFASAGGAS